MLHIEPRHDHAAVVVGARSLDHALIQACHLLERDWLPADATQLE